MQTKANSLHFPRLLPRNSLAVCLLLGILALIARTAEAQEPVRLDGSRPDASPAVQPTPTPATGWGKPLPPASAAAATRPSARPAAKISPAKPSPATPIGNSNTPADTAQPASPPAPSEKPAQPASVTFHDGILTVHAANSNISQILEEISVQTGMVLEGKPEEERVFGDFGPAPVTTVLGQLLDGGPSNYVVFGMSELKAPRSLVVTPRTSLAPGEVVANNTRPAQTVDDDEDDDDQPAPITPIRQAPLNNNGVTPPPGARTPQQILDDMQRRRQQQQDQPQEQSQ